MGGIRPRPFFEWQLLLIEDDEDDFMILKDLLASFENLHFNVQWAPTYEAGLEALDQQDWDAILVDYDLGLHNGLEIIRQVVERGLRSPAIMVTGRGRYELDLEAQQAGAADYISKSELTPALLERTIRYAIEKQHVEEDLERRVAQRTSELSEALEKLQLALEEQQVLEEELRQQNEEIHSYNMMVEKDARQYRTLFDLAPAAYLVTDSSGKVLQANQAAAGLLGVEQPASFLKPLAVYVAQQDQPRFFAHLNKAVQDHQVEHLELEITPRKQEPLQCDVTLSAFDNDGQTKLLWLFKALRLAE